MTLTNGKTSNLPVQVGAIGSALTEIKSGLTAGTTVVLADLSQPLPSSNTAGNRPAFVVGGPGAFAGGGGGRFGG
jgi:HlyD family secretion protein